jgi:predicted Zn finger-like uncharacterized protein
MIIQCNACRAKFRLDEGKIRGRGAKVRCRKCGEMILVMKPGEGAEAEAPASAAAPLPTPAEGPAFVPPPAPQPGPVDDLTRAPLSPSVVLAAEDDLTRLPLTSPEGVSGTAAPLPWDRPSPSAPASVDAAPPPPAASAVEEEERAEGGDEGPSPSAEEESSWLEGTAHESAGDEPSAPSPEGGTEAGNASGGSSWFEETAVGGPAAEKGPFFPETPRPEPGEAGGDGEEARFPGGTETEEEEEERGSSWLEGTAVASPEPPAPEPPAPAGEAPREEGFDEGPSSDEDSWFGESAAEEAAEGVAASRGAAPAAEASPARGAGDEGKDLFGSMSDEPLDLRPGGAAAPASTLPPFGEPFPPFVPPAAPGGADPFAAAAPPPSPPPPPAAAPASPSAAAPSDAELDDFFLDLSADDAPPAPPSSAPPSSLPAGEAPYLPPPPRREPERTAPPPSPSVEIPDFLAVPADVAGSGSVEGAPSSPTGRTTLSSSMELPASRGAGRAASSRALAPGVIAVAAAALLLAGGGGWLAFSGTGQGILRSTLPRLASFWSGGAEKKAAVGLKNLTMTSLPGTAAGDLVVIRGEVENLSGGPKSRLQVEAKLIDEAGREVGRKKVYAGNVLTEEELAAATPEEISRRLASPLGDRLSNLDVPTGRAVPFTVVFTKTPPGSFTSAVKPIASE